MGDIGTLVFKSIFNNIREVISTQPIKTPINAKLFFFFMGVFSIKNKSSFGDPCNFDTFIDSKLYLSATLGFESGFSGLQRGVFGLSVRVIQRGLLFIPFFCKDAMPRVFSPIGFNLTLPATLGFESGFSGFPELQRTSSLWVQWLFVEDYLLSSFSPMRYASVRAFVMKAPFNDNLTTQTVYVMVNPINPVNPDSKLGDKGEF